MKKQIILRSLGILLCSVLFITMLSARQTQPSLTDNVLQQRLSELKQQLDFLKNVAKQFPSPKLQDLIRQSEIHVQKAFQAYQLKQYGRASEEIKITRKLINQGLKLIMSGPATRLLERVNEKIHLAEDLLNRNFNPPAQKRLEDAKDSRKRALSFKDRNVQKMVEWLRVALSQANNAIKQLSTSSANVDLMSAIHEEKSNFDDLKRRAQNMLGQNHLNLAQNLFNQALAQQKRADTAFSRGNVQRAIESYRWASRLMLRVIDLTGGSEINWQRRAEEELQLTRGLLRSVEGSIDLKTSPGVQKLYQQATRVYLDAEQSFANKNYSETVRKAELARRVLNRANQLMGHGRDRIKFQFIREAETVKNMLAQLQQEFDAQQDPTAARMWETAQKYLDLAIQENNANRPFLAKANLFLSTRFTRGLRNYLQAKPDEITEQNALSQYELLKQRYDNLVRQYENSTDRKIQTWLNLAKDILNIAEIAKNSSQYQVLLVNIRICQQILDQIESS